MVYSTLASYGSPCHVLEEGQELRQQGFRRGVIKALNTVDNDIDIGRRVLEQLFGELSALLKVSIDPS